VSVTALIASILLMCLFLVHEVDPTPAKPLDIVFIVSHKGGSINRVDVDFCQRMVSMLVSPVSLILLVARV